MNPARLATWWVGTLALSSAALMTGCASLSTDQAAAADQPQVMQITQSDEDDESQLVAQLRSDLNRFNSREIARKPTIAPSIATAGARDSEFANRARALFSPLSGSALRMPVVGIRSTSLSDSWHDPRDGGSRVHKGIDIF